MTDWTLRCPNGHPAVIEVLSPDVSTVEIEGGCREQSCEYRKVSEYYGSMVVQIGNDSKWYDKCDEGASTK